MSSISFVIRIVRQDINNINNTKRGRKRERQDINNINNIKRRRKRERKIHRPFC